MARVLVTGATGFVGSHLVRRCVQQGDEVTALARETSDAWRLDDLLGRVDIRRCALAEADGIARIVARARPELVFHLATTPKRVATRGLGDATDSVTSDLAGLINVLAACQEAADPPKAFVRAASIAEYGHGPETFTEEDRERPDDVYGAAMLAATRFVECLRPRLSFPARSARLALVYGPMQSRRFLVPALIESCLNGEPITVENPDDRRDIVYIDDAVEGLLRVAGTRSEETLFNISSGRAPDMREIAGAVVVATGARPELVACRSRRPSVVPSVLKADPGRAARVLGWTAGITLRVGLARTVEACDRHLERAEARSA